MLRQGLILQRKKNQETMKTIRAAALGAWLGLWGPMYGQTPSFHGRLQVDVGASVSDSGIADPVAGIGLRRLRLTAKGAAGEQLGYKLSVDFGKNKLSVKDAYVDLRVCERLRVRAGNFKEPYRWDALNSSNRILLPGRPEVVGAFGKVRNAGVMVYGKLWGPVGYQVGLFRSFNAGPHQVLSVDPATGTGGYFLSTNRLSAVPLQGEERWLMAAGYFRQQIGRGASYSIKAGSESMFGPRLVSLHIDTMKDSRWVGGELAASFGPLYFQGEYLVFQGGLPGGRSVLSGGYVQMAYVLTGEHRRLKSAFSGVKEIKPATPWGKGGMCGAWEVVGRYEIGNFNGAGLQGGGLRVLSVGLNWYPYSRARVMLNYVRPVIQGSDRLPDGGSHIFQTRLMIFF